VHWLELEVLKDLSDKRNLVLGAEMLEADNQKQINQYDNNSLNKALNTSKQKDSQQDYEPHEAKSSGWCYVGEERGSRTCAQVGVDDICMSGDIFPSQEICMNPSLRT
jgi:hypothetical protein